MFKTQVDNIETFQEIHSKHDISLQHKERINEMTHLKSKFIE